VAEVLSISPHELEIRLKEYESLFGMTTSVFVKEYTNGMLPEEDAPYLDWYMTYDAFRLLANGSGS
jgi:hypothetical protein